MTDPIIRQMILDEDRRRARVRVLTSNNPDQAGEANRLARRTGVPAEVVERNMPEVVSRDRARVWDQALARNPRLAGWIAQPRNAAVAVDDWRGLRDVDDAMTAAYARTAQARRERFASADGFVDRAGALAARGLSNLEGGLLTLGAALREWSANNPLPWTSADSSREDRAAASQLRRRAAQLGSVSSAAITGSTTWQDVKARPSVGNVLSFGLETGVESLPAMAASAVAMPFLAASQAGNIGQQRAENNGRPFATISDIGKAAPFAIGSAAFERFGVHKILGATGRNVATRVGKAAASEAATEAAQSALEYTGGAAGTDAGFKLGDAADQIIAGMVGGGVMGGALRAGGEVASGSARRVLQPLSAAEQAVADAEALDGIAAAAEKSKTRARDPEAFAALLDSLGGDAVENVYLPAEAVRAYFQQDSDYDREFWQPLTAQLDEALATGGDVVIPASAAIAHLAGTRAWDALRADMRLTPGGMSLREAEAFEGEYADVVDRMAQEGERQAAKAAEAAAPRDRLEAGVYDQLTAAGFTPDVARTYSALIGNREATRAARLGRELTGDEYQTQIRRILPEGLAPLASVDNLGVVIAAMRRGREAQTKPSGPSLLEWISSRGGVADLGGDIASMGGDRWHRGAPFRKRLIRAVDRDQVSMLGGPGDNAFSPDVLLQDAIDAGYFPELLGRDETDGNLLLEAIGEELAGAPRYASEIVNDETQRVREAAAQLEELLGREGLDPASMSDAQVRAAVERFSAASNADGYEQSAQAQQWARTVDRIIRGDRRERFAPLGPVPARLRQVGLGAGNLFMSSDKLARVRREHPEVPLDVLRALPDLLPDPLAAFPSARRDGSIVVAIDAIDVEGNPIIVPIAIDASGVNIVLSVHGKDAGVAWIKRQIDQARREGIAVYEKEGFADTSSEPDASEEVSSPPAPIALGGPAKPARPILSLRSKSKDLEQGGDEGVRGRFLPEQRIIELFASSDLSTFIHETGHEWAEQLREDATSEDAPAQLKADWQTVVDWFAENGHPLNDDGSIPVEAHEMWARAVERYMMEGKAPTTALRRAFDAFRSWLLSIYEVVQRLRTPLSDEVRDVMSRLIATDEEIAAAAAEQEIGALFSDADAAGMTEAEFAAYQASTRDARTEAFEALLFRTMATVRAARRKEFRDQRETVRAERAQEIEARPVFKALALIRGGQRLDKAWLVERFGVDVLDQLPKAVPPIYADKGVRPADVAELSGYASAEDMVRALMGLEARRKELRAGGDKRSPLQSTIDQETDAIMADRYGDPLADGSIEREARELIHGEQQGEVIASELRALHRLSRRSSDPQQAPTPYQLAKRWAERKVAEGLVRDVASRSAIQQYQRAARKAARAAEAAMLAGDIDETYRQKQSQLLNNALIQAATKAADDIDAAVARMSKIAKRRTMKSVDQDYLEQAQTLLEAVELRERSQLSINRQGKFEAWARAQEADGIDVVVPASFEASLGTTHWSRLPVERLLGLDASIDQIMSLGRLKQTLIDNNERREFEAVVREAVDSAGGLRQRPPSDLMEPSWADRFRSGVANVDASLLKLEQVFDWLDGGRSDGVFNRVAFKPIAEAQHRERVMVDDYLNRIRTAFERIPAERARAWGDKVEVTEFLNRETGNPWVFTRQQLVAVALNMGNEGNIQRLTDGYGWNVSTVRDVLNRELTADEWRFVQEVWDIIDTLWPEISAMERRVNGVAPEKIEATPLETPAGVLRGGYYPAIYDSAKSYRAEQFSGESLDLLEGNYTRATTRASATKAREEKVSRPILLQVGVINRHLGEVIHDITHREPVINAWRFLGEERVMKAVDASLGSEVRQQFKPWLRHIANSWAQDRAGLTGFAAFMNGLRSNTTIVGMGWRMSTIMMQVAGYSNSFEKVGARWVAPAIAQVAARPVQSFNFVMERSGEIAGRMDSLDRDVRLALDAMQGKKGGVWEAKRFMFHGIGYMDRLVVVPTWMGAYNKALAAGLDEAAAIYEADKAVRLSQGAGAPKDLAAIARGKGPWGEVAKLLTMFYSYLSTVWARQRTLGRDVRSAIGERDYRKTPQLVARAWWLLVVPPLLSELLAGRGPDDEEDWGWWAFSRMLFQALGPIPLVRDLAPVAWARATDDPTFGYALSPIQRAGQTAVNAFADLGSIAEGEETKRATRNVLETAGYATGLVPGQFATAAQFLVDVGYGDVEPETVSDWWQGLTTGKIAED